VDDYLDTR
jgi:hypothetical protein